MTADLPVRAAAPVDYVRTCPNAPIGGTGFFVIPGTETCLQVSGYVRVDYRFSEKVDYRISATGNRERRTDRQQDAVNFFARGSIAFDARTPTEYGTLRSFIRITADNIDGAADATAIGSTFLDQGFIQFAGLTAGRITSFFSFWGGNMMSGNAGVTDPSVELLAYTATFGSGFSATVSVENGKARRTTVPATWVGFTPSTGAGAVTNTATNIGTSFVGLGDFGSGASYGGQDLPDLVANLNVTQAWGSAQVMGALHQIRHNVANVATDDELGYAVGAGVNIRLPMIAAGDALWLQAVYADGALSYLGAPTTVTDYTIQNRDALLVAGNLRTATGFSLAAGFRHFWTPTFWQDIQGAYGEIDNQTPPAATAFVGALSSYQGIDYSWYQLGTRVNWRPVTGLTVSADVSYTHIDPERLIFSFGGPPAVISDESSRWAGRLRIQRDF